MAIRQCAYGHTYDDEEYSSCPKCNPNAKFIDFDNDRTVRTSSPVHHQNFTGIDDSAAAPSDYSGFGIKTSQAGETLPGNMGGFTDDPFDKTVAPNRPGVKLSQAGETLPGNMGGFTDDPFDKTVGPINQFTGFGRKVSDINKTVGVINVDNGSSASVEPVVGWLVGLNGKIIGKDFRLKAGYNSIGRSKSCNIYLEDNTVSREKFVNVVYDPESNSYFVSAQELTYINGQVILQPTLLKPYDILKVGTQKLLFIPLCCDKFKWNSPS